MSDNVKKVLMVIGAIVTIYLLIAYVLPFIIKLIGIALVFIFKLLLWAAIIVGIFIILNFVIKNLKK